MLSNFFWRRANARLKLIERLRRMGAISVTVGDVSVTWDSVALVPVEANLPLMPEVISPRPSGVFGRTPSESQTLEILAKERAAAERASGLPEFREEADILAAEEALARGQQVPPADRAGIKDGE